MGTFDVWLDEGRGEDLVVAVVVVGVSQIVALLY